ncbi:protein IN CHLOROPLAST ATPASE BIOGENESIS [Citrus sinensis]|nr:protein IN CHLOROPLAST ATPASE BIOGENESIS [Citrus sinensis]
MKMGVTGAIHRAPCAAALPLRHVRARPIRCSSSSGHVSFIKDIAVANPPEHLDELLKVLRTRGDTIVSPGSRQGIIPLAIPLSENSSGAVTALLRWPTAPSGMEMPVVEVRKRGVWLLGKNVDQYIHRLLVEEEAHHLEKNNGELYDASSEAGKKLYQRGDFAESNITNLDSYLLSKVGLFPDVLEHKVTQHFEQGDHAVASIAQWEDEQIEYIKEKITEEGKQEDLKKGKAPAQIALDEAAFLLDLASIEGTWAGSLERIADCYKEGGLDEIARFILYRD